MLQPLEVPPGEYPPGGPELIQSQPQGSLPGLSGWVEVGGTVSFPWLKAPLKQPIST